MASPALGPISRRLSIGLAALSLALSASAQPTPSASQLQRQPVLVELFTSEGCSDCPPADALLARLDSTQFVPNAQAIVLSEHVTYWNHLGWRDPFSSSAMDERQHQYSLHFSLDEDYTPQAVVDGSQQFVGGDTAALTRAVAHSTAYPKQQIAIENARLASGAVSFSVRAASASGTKLIAAIAEDATRSEVARGENAGRTLHHVAVVRVLKEFDPKSGDGRPLQLAYQPLSGQLSTSGPLRLVVFFTDRNSGRVLAVTQQTISR